MPREASFPDGISETHLQPKSSTRLLNLVLMAILAALMLGTFTGVLGGHPSDAMTVRTAAADFTVVTPQKLRNGEFFETRISVTAKRALEAPSIAVSSEYWNNVTINTIMPDPANQLSKNGYFVLEYDALKPGDVLFLKIDGQTNPTLRGGSLGALELRDDDEVIARLPLRLKVLP